MRTTCMAIVAVAAVLGTVCGDVVSHCGTAAPSSRGLLHTLTFDSAGAFAMSADGKVVAVGGGSSVGLVDGSQWTVTRALAVTSEVVAVALSPDGRYVAAGLYDNTVGVWDVSSGAQVAALAGRSKLAAGLAFSPDGRLLASTTTGVEVKLWSVGSWREPRIFSGLPDVWELPGVFARQPLDRRGDSWLLPARVVDGDSCCMGCRDGPESSTAPEKRHWGLRPRSPDGRSLCTDSSLWDTRSGQVLYTLSLPGGDALIGSTSW